MKKESKGKGNALQISKDIDAMEKMRRRERKEKERIQEDFLDLDVDIHMEQ